MHFTAIIRALNLAITPIFPYQVHRLITLVYAFMLRSNSVQLWRAQRRPGCMHAAQPLKPKADPYGLRRRELLLLGGASAAASQLPSAAAPAAAAAAVDTDLKPAQVPETVELGRSGEFGPWLDHSLKCMMPSLMMLHVLDSKMDWPLGRPQMLCQEDHDIEVNPPQRSQLSHYYSRELALEESSVLDFPHAWKRQACSPWEPTQDGDPTHTQLCISSSAQAKMDSQPGFTPCFLT